MEWQIFNPVSPDSFTAPLLFDPEFSGNVNFYDTAPDGVTTTSLGPGSLVAPPTGSRSFANAAGSPLPLPSGLTRSYGIAAGDFNNDGILDLAVTSQAAPGNILILLGKGDGTFNALPPILVGPQPVCVVVADFDGDGKQDLAIANQGDIFDSNTTTHVVTILRGQGDGTFTALPSILTTSRSPLYLASGDFNGDGIADLVVIDQRNVDPRR